MDDGGVRSSSRRVADRCSPCDRAGDVGDGPMERRGREGPRGVFGRSIPCAAGRTRRAMEAGGTLTVRLKKRDVERLLDDYDADPIAALTAALRTTLAMPAATWESLVRAASIEPNLRERLLKGELPALDRLAVELNERRCLDDHR